MSNDFLLRIIFWLYSDKLVQDRIFLEGGAALHFLYGIKRKFSYDIDLTLAKESDLPILLKSLHKFVGQDENSGIAFKVLDDHSIGLFKNHKLLTSIDFYVQSIGSFAYECRKIEWRKSETEVQTHSLDDILAEKICNALQRDRIEFKDINDIPLIYSYLRQNDKAKNLRKLTQQKLKYKKILMPTQKKLANYWQDREKDFLSSFNTGDWAVESRDFNEKYEQAYKITANLLFGE